MPVLELINKSVIHPLNKFITQIHSPTHLQLLLLIWGLLQTLNSLQLGTNCIPHFSLCTLVMQNSLQPSIFLIASAFA